MPPFGAKHSPETIEKIRAAHLRNPRKGFFQTEEARAKMRAHNGQKSGALNSCWRGGRHLMNGYVKVRLASHPFAKNGYVLEHRLVMEQHLGRYLSLNENVHHKNNIRTDNRLENLELMTRGEHSRHHRLLETSLGITGARTRKKLA